MTQDTSKALFHSATRYFSGTLLSRVTGMLRDMIMAFCFGTAASLASFLVVYRLVYLIRRLFGEGLLHQGFIPHFETARAKHPKQGFLFFRDLFWNFAFVLGSFLFISEIILSFFQGEMIRLAMCMLPGIYFICLFGLFSGILHAEKKFFLSSVSPALSNVVWIFGILLFSPFPIETGLVGLACTISVAFFIQWVVTVPKIWYFMRQELSIREIFTFKIFSKELKDILSPLILGITGVAATQINSAVDALFAQYANPEGPAYLWYAIRLQQLPLALFGIALSSALLPPLARAIEQGNNARYSELLIYAKRKIFILIFPCTIGIFILGTSSINLLFGHGDFTPEATYQTTLCLWGYAIGLLPSAFVQMLAQGFYARKNYRVPATGFLYSALLNIFLNTCFVLLNWGPAAIALATSIASFFNVIYLSRKLHDSNFTFLKSKFILGVTFSCLAAGIIVISTGYFILNDATLRFFDQTYAFSRTFPRQLLEFSIQTGLYFFIFFSLCKVFKLRDALPTEWFKKI